MSLENWRPLSFPIDIQARCEYPYNPHGNSLRMNDKSSGDQVYYERSFFLIRSTVFVNLMRSKPHLRIAPSPGYMDDEMVWHETGLQHGCVCWGGPPISVVSMGGWTPPSAFGTLRTISETFSSECYPLDQETLWRNATCTTRDGTNPWPGLYDTGFEMIQGLFSDPNESGGDLPQ